MFCHYYETTLPRHLQYRTDCVEAWESQFEMFSAFGGRIFLVMVQPLSEEEPLAHIRRNITKLLLDNAAQEELFLLSDEIDTENPYQTWRWIFPYFVTNQSQILKSAQNVGGLISKPFKTLCECIMGKITLLDRSWMYRHLNSPERFLHQVVESDFLQQIHKNITQYHHSSLLQEITLVIEQSSKMSIWDRYFWFENATASLVYPNVSKELWIEVFDLYFEELLPLLPLLPSSMNYTLLQKLHNGTELKTYEDPFNKATVTYRSRAGYFFLIIELDKEILCKLHQRMAVSLLENFILTLNSFSLSKPIILLTNKIHESSEISLRNTLLTSPLNF